MSRRQQSWFAVPFVLLTVGILLAGFVLYKIVTRGENKKSHEQRSVNTATVERPTCGNGVCENVSCASTNCPKPEDELICPQDCSDTAVGGNDDNPAETNSNGNDNANTNTPHAALNFRLLPQSAANASSCSLNAANMSAADAVGAAAAIGLEQGVSKVEVTFELSEPPLSECVWNIKNYVTSITGKVVTVIDSTQDILRTVTWK